MPISIRARLVDGGFLAYEKPDSIVADLRRLESQGLKDKQLVHALITDDWGPPPLYVQIVGETAAGEVVDVSIPYR